MKLITIFVSVIDLIIIPFAREKREKEKKYEREEQLMCKVAFTFEL